MKKPKALSIERDLPLLRWLWRWKISTTAAIDFKFFSHCNSSLIAYNRLRILEKNKFIEIRYNEQGLSPVWVLADKGFKAIRESLPTLKQEGFKSENINHDIVVTSAHLGRWVQRVPKHVDLFSEQQLRRYNIDEYPTWIPKTDLHRPDGYWRIQKDIKHEVIALEVERSRKSNTEYKAVGRFYNQVQQIDKVLWIVGATSFGNHLQRIFSEPLVPFRSIHNFILEDDFRKLGWLAKIKIGPDTEKTFAELLGEQISFPSHLSVMKAPLEEMSRLLLETRITGLRSDIYKKPQLPRMTVTKTLEGSFPPVLGH